MDDAPTDFEALVRAADRAYVSPPDFATYLGEVTMDMAPWQRELETLRAARSEQPQGRFDAAVSVWMRAAAVDTGAIEGLYETDQGFTMSVARGMYGVETMEAEKGPDFVAHYEAQLAGYEMALDAATEAIPVSESWLRQLHEVVTRGQDSYRVRTDVGWQDQSLPKGEYKRHPNHVQLADGLHSYAPVDETAAEVQRLVEALRSADFGAAHPMIQSAYSHYALAAIHPFADGNGRVCRALASVFLLRASSTPLMVFADQKDRYLEALRSADAGDHASFVRFVRDRSVDTIRQVVDSLEVPTADDSGSMIRSTYVAANGYRHDRLDQMATEIRNELGRALERELNHLDLPPDVERSTQVVDSPASATPTGWRVRLDDKAPRAAAAVATRTPPARADWSAAVLVGTTADPLDGFAIAAPDERLVVLDVREAAGGISTSLSHRIAAVAKRAVSTLQSDLATQHAAANEQRGF